MGTLEIYLHAKDTGINRRLRRPSTFWTGRKEYQSNVSTELRQLFAGRAGLLKLGLTNKKGTQSGSGEQQYRQRAAKLHTDLEYKWR